MGEAESEAISSGKRKQKFENPKVHPEKKAKSFCCRTFRQELRGNDALKSLKKFISAAKNSDNVIYDYMEHGGSLQELLSLLDPTATGDLTTALPVFEALHLIFLRFQSSDSEYHQKCIASGRIILRSYLLILKAMLSMNISKQKKVALKILTAIATLDSSFANEIMNVIALSPALVTALIQPSPEKESVRKCFILFVLSFLIEGNLIIIKSLLEKKGFLSSIIPGLKFDEAATVNLTLSLFKEKILKNMKIPKTLKLKMFNTQILKSLFDLYDWKGLQGIKQFISIKNKAIKEVEINQNEKEIVIESVHSFLLLLCCSQKFGVAFYDKSMGTSEELNNQLLLTVFESLPDPLKNKKISEVMLKTIANCPDLMKPVLLKLEPSFQPRNSKNWFQAMEFAENLIKAMDAVGILKKEEETVTANQIIKVGKALCAPVVLLKFIKLGSQKSQVMEIRLRSLTLLTAIWAEMQRLFSVFQNFENDFKKSLCKHVYKSLPDAEELLELWRTLCDTEFFAGLPFAQEKRILFLSAVLESLHMITECQRDAVSSPLSLASDLLSSIEIIKDSISQREFDDIQVKIVQFVEIDFQALRSDTELFEKSLIILFRSTDEASLSYLSKFLTSLEIFKRNKPEVDVWLLSFLSLPQEFRSSVADFLIESIRLFFKKETGSDRDLKMLFKGETEKDNQTTEESLTPLLFNCVEIFKSHSSKSLNKDEKLQSIRHYLNDVIIHLQHFYSLDMYLYDHVKDVKGLGKSILSYLKGWKDNSANPFKADVFSCRLDSDLVSWLVNDKESQSFEKILKVENIHLLKRYSLFRTVVAYLNSKTFRRDLLRDDVEKFTAALSFFLDHGPEDDRGKVDLISLDVENKAVYQRHCLNCLFRNKYLLNMFDAFREKENDVSYATDIISKVLLEKDIIKNFDIKKQLSEPWKFRFLKQLKAKLKNNKSIDGLNNLEKVLNFFEYEHSDVAEMLELLTSVSKLDLFVHKNTASAWTVILSKFIKLHCQKEELNGIFVKKLCLIMEHLRGRHCSKLEKLENCFVDLLREHPSHLLLIDDEFLNVILLATNITTTTSILGKLLLNDPSKVRHFLNFIGENLKNAKEPQIIYSLLSALIVKEDSFFGIIKLDSVRSVWEISEISPSETPDLFKALEIVYRKFEKNILRTLAGEEDEFVLKNLTLTRELIKFFLDKKEIKKLKKEILKGKFEPELLCEAVRKINLDEVTENYMRGLLTLFCRIIEESKDLEEVVWKNYCSIVSDVVELNKESSWQSVVDAPEWKRFAKLALGHCFSVKYSSLLKILRVLFTTFYKFEQFKDCGFFFQMLISHSQFLKIMLSDSPLKIELVEFYRWLIEKSPSEMSSKHFPILLASYTASLSPCDRMLLQLLRFYEMNEVEVSNYEPFVWGDPAVSHYSIGTSSGLSLWQRFNMANVLDLLDGQRMELSLREFPIRRSLEASQNIDCDSNVYDPAFVLPLFVNLLSPGAVVFCLPFIYKGALAYTVRALSSECKDVRLLASLVLTRFYNHLELSQKLKQKLVWMHFINCFRFGIENLSAKPLPNITTLFFARMTLELSSQSAEMYLPLQSFLLAKPYFAFDAVPEFLPLFHSSEVPHCARAFELQQALDGFNAAFVEAGMKICVEKSEVMMIARYPGQCLIHLDGGDAEAGRKVQLSRGLLHELRKHRLWLLEVIRDGTKTTSDMKIIFRSMVLKVIFCFFFSQLCDNETKKIILQAVERMLRIDKSSLLISEYGLLNWITAIDSGSFQTILHDLLNLLYTLTGVILKDIQTSKSKQSNHCHLIQILNMAINLLPCLKHVKSVEYFKLYLKIINECFRLFTKKGKSDWFKLHKNYLFDIVDAGVVILGENYDYGKFCKVPFYFRSFDENFDYEELKNSVFLFNALVNR